MKIGLKFKLGSFWIGWHWSGYNKRLCLNLIPCMTIFFVLKGGNLPLQSNGLPTFIWTEERRKLL